MNFIKVLLLVCFTTNLSFAGDTRDFLSAFGDGDWATDYESTPKPIDTSYEPEAVVKSSSVITTTRPEEACNKSEQTSLPQRMVRSLLSKRKFEVYHDASSQKLTLDGGTMIGNCNDMIQYNFEQPKNGRPYVFQVEIRKPATGCKEKAGKTVCPYKGRTATDGVTEDKRKDIMVEPNYYGFIQCLRKTGVMNGNSMVKSKISPVKFKHQQNGVGKTAKVLYYCHGPECNKGNVRMSASVHPPQRCQHFENIKKGGFKAYSLQDINKNRKTNLYQSICNSKQYQLIEENLSKFSEFQEMEQSLIKIRNKFLLKEVEKLHTELTAKDYSKLSASKYQRIINDFYTKIVLPKRKELEAKVRKIDSLPEGDKRNREKAKLASLALELVKLTKSPYLASADYKNMISFVKKSPLHKEKWRDAALKLYAVNNTAYHFSRYHPKLAKKYKLENVSAEDAVVYIKQDVNTQRTKIEKIGALAEDSEGTVSYAQEYKMDAEGVMIDHRNHLQDLKEEYSYAQQYEQQNCYNSQAGMWGLVQQNCIMQARNNQASIIEEANYLNSQQYMQSSIYPQVQSNMELSSEWATIEAQRNQAYGISARPGGSRLGNNPAAYRGTNYSQMMQQQYDRNGYLNRGDVSMYSQILQRQALQNQQQRYGGNQYGSNPYGSTQYNRGPAGGYGGYNTSPGYQYQYSSFR